MVLAESPLGVADDGVSRLVSASQYGDVDAFDQLVDLYADRVHRFVASRVPPAEAEDLVQQVFTKMIEALPRYEDRGLPFGAWLFKIARNVVIDAERRRRDDLPLEGVALLVDGGPEPAQVLESSERRLELGLAIRSLPPDQRDIIALRFYGDLPVRDVARLLGKSEGTVRVSQFRALRALRRRLGPGAVRLDHLRLGEAKA